MKTTTVFQSGHSQAVRMPKEFRFAVRTVTIRREVGCRLD
jgi:virulence-associated protein VagC